MLKASLHLLASLLLFPSLLATFRLNWRLCCCRPSIFLLTLASPTVACSPAVAGFPPVASIPCCCKHLGCYRRPCHCRCLAVAVDPADVNFLAAIGIHTCMLPTFSGTLVVACVPAIAGILDAAGVSVVAGVLAVFGVVPAMSSCMTALCRNCVTFNTFRHF
jgi:hypothetical protein